MNIFNYFGFLIAGSLAQFVDSLLGMGYGVTSSTLLISFGLYPAIVSATVHFSEIFTSFVSGILHLKLGNSEKKIFLPLAIYGIAGGVIGAYGLVTIHTQAMRKVIAIVLFAMGCLILAQFILKRFVLNIFQDKKSWKLGLLGFFSAFIDAIGGGGWGPICTPTLVANGIEPRHAIGSVNLAEFFVTLSITLTFITTLGINKFRWDVAVILILSGLIISPIAAYLCKKLQQKIIGICVGLMIMFLSARVFLK